MDRQKYQSVITFQARNQEYASNKAKSTLKTSMTSGNRIREYGKRNIVALTTRKTPKITEMQTKITSTARVTVLMLSYPDKEEGQHSQRTRQNSQQLHDANDLSLKHGSLCKDKSRKSHRGTPLCGCF